ncbi:exported hypothetical protein [groundwater metagenome]|uniref:Dockerin domain-containing protein n=1 Tax=groundwater metagenome TaxID=717931 RepID=A0A098E6Q5_9ZZZZ
MNKIFSFIFVLLIVLVLSVQQISAECNATVWGKIDFSKYPNSAATNVTIQISNMVDGFPISQLNPTQTDENGFYTTNIFFNSTSKNISVKITKENQDVKEYPSIQINCSDNISINYSVEKCTLTTIQYAGCIKDIKDGNFVNINETDEGEEVKIYLAAVPKDSKGVYNESVNFTKTGENGSFCVLPVDIYSFWQTNLTSWADPTKNYYYRVYDDKSYSVINSSNYSSLMSCGLSAPVRISKNFIRFPRKSVGDNCSHGDECRSNFCDQTSRTCQCNCHADCAGDQICNATNQCQNLICQPPNGTIFNYTCVNCTDDATCGEQFCNLITHACQPIYCNINETCRSNQFCNITSQCQTLFCLGNQRVFNHTCINCSSYDFDNNNITDIFDAVSVLEYISGEKKDISGCADVDNNRIIDLFDAAYILYYL